MAKIILPYMKSPIHITEVSTNFTDGRPGITTCIPREVPA